MKVRIYGEINNYFFNQNGKLIMLWRLRLYAAR